MNNKRISHADVLTDRKDGSSQKKRLKSSSLKSVSMKSTYAPAKKTGAPVGKREIPRLSFSPPASPVRDNSNSPDSSPIAKRDEPGIEEEENDISPSSAPNRDGVKNSPQPSSKKHSSLDDETGSIAAKEKVPSVGTVTPVSRQMSISVGEIALCINKSVSASESRIMKRLAKQGEVITKVLSDVTELTKTLEASCQFSLQLREDICNLSAVVGGNNGVGAGISAKRKPSNHDFVQRTFKKYPLLRREMAAIFGPDIETPALCATVTFYLSKLCQKRNSFTAWKTGVAVLMFRKKQKLTKAVFKTGVGRGYSSMRMSLMRCVIKLAIEEHGQQDKREEEGGEGEGSASVPEAENVENGTPKPKWLRRDVLGKQEMQTARIDDELVKTEFEDLKAEGDELESVGTVVCAELLKQLTCFLREGRTSAKKRFFEDISFLFDSWKCCNFLTTHELDQVEAPTVVFLFDQKSFCAAEQIYKISTCAEENFKILESFYNERREMFVETSYDVWVASKLTRQGKPQKNCGWVKKRMHRLQSLLALALNFLMAFCNCQTREEFLGEGEDSFAVLYRVAVMFRQMISHLINTGSNLPEEGPVGDEKEEGSGVENTGLNGDGDSGAENGTEDCDEVKERAGDSTGVNVGDGTHLLDYVGGCSDQVNVIVCMKELTPGTDSKRRILDSLLRLDPKGFSAMYREGPSTQARAKKTNYLGKSKPEPSEKGEEGVVDDGADAGKISEALNMFDNDSDEDVDTVMK